MKKAFKKIRECVPIWCAVLFVIFIAAMIVFAVAKKNSAFADAIHDNVGMVIRALFATVTSPLPFSVAEYLLITSPVLVFLVVRSIFVQTRKSATLGIRRAVCFLAIASLVYSTYIFGSATGFYGKGVDDRLGLDRRDVAPEELYDTAMILIDQMKEDIPAVCYPEGSYSVMDFSYEEMNEKLNAAYETLCDKYPEFQRLHSETKPVILSEPWTYTHISGMFTFFTGEANVNVNYPDFIVVSSAAHEMAHQRGINKEDEANFVAYLVCSLSDDPYVRYAGTLDVLNSVMNDLYSADKELWKRASAEMPKEVKWENAAYSGFFDKYRENVAEKVTTAVNNAYISSNNQPAGVKSYGLVVDLVVAYYRDAK